MPEHIRDFLDPEIDKSALVMLESADDPSTLAAAAIGRKVFVVMGAERQSNTDDGEVWRFHDKDGNPADVEFRHPSAIAAWTLSGSRGMFNSYTGSTEALWKPVTASTHIPESAVTGYPESDSLVSVTLALHHMTRVPRSISQGVARAVAPIKDRWAQEHWEPSTERTKEEIARHYDHDQPFYVEDNGWGILGPTEQYSSGYVFPDQEDIGLDQAQEQKIDLLIKKLRVDSADTLLEIGSGWGGLAIAIAKRAPHLHITSLTVSHEQVKRARAMAREAGVEDQIDFREMDYRDLDPSEIYDRIVSVEMIEAVDSKDLPDYYDAIDRHLAPRIGTATIQSINVSPQQEARQKHHKGFAQEVFPGGSLVAKQSIVRDLGRHGLYLHEQTDLTPSYPLTLTGWRANMHMADFARLARRTSQGITPEQSARSDRGFDLYLSFSDGGFRTRNIEDWQLTFARS